MIYLDYAANTPVDPAVLERFCQLEHEWIGNPNASHRAGRAARAELARITDSIASLLGVYPSEVLYTSGASEANNTAVKGLVQAAGTAGRHVISTPLEHASINGCLEFLRTQGYTVDLLNLRSDGTVDLAHLDALLRVDTVLVSVCAVDSELGIQQPIEAIAAHLQNYPNCRFHVDATQAVGRTDLSFSCADTMSFAPHKFYGLNGSGILLKRRRIPLMPLIHGGGQERGRRSGTENVAGAVGMAAALQERIAALDTNMPRLTALRDKIIREMLRLPYARLTGHPDDRLPSIASLVFEGIEGESILLQLDARGICASSGSACSSTSLEPSHVLLAIGLPHAIAHGSVRLSLGDDITEDEVDTIIQDLTEVVNDLRVLSPVWDVAAQRPAW